MKRVRDVLHFLHGCSSQAHRGDDAVPHITLRTVCHSAELNSYSRGGRRARIIKFVRHTCTLLVLRIADLCLKMVYAEALRAEGVQQVIYRFAKWCQV